MLVFTSNMVIPARNVIIVAASAKVPFISIVLVVALTFDVLLPLLSRPTSILLLFIIGTVALLLLLSIRTNLAIISQSFGLWPHHRPDLQPPRPKMSK